MKVLQINAVYQFSSTGRTCSELHEELKKHSIESMTAYGERKGDFPDTFYVGNIFDHKLHGLLSRITGKAGYFSVFQTLRLLRFISSYQPDVVHLRNLHANFVCVPMLMNYLAKNRIPTVITLHDCLPFTGRCCYYTNLHCDKWETVCGDCKHNKEMKSWFFDTSRSMFLDKQKQYRKIPDLAVIGVSDWMTNEAKRSPLFPPKTLIRRIYNWVDLNIFHDVGRGILENLGLTDKFVVLGVSSCWSDEKGLDDFLYLAAHMPEDCRILLVGKMDEKVRLPANIISVGSVAGAEELARYYSAGDVFVSPSVQETFGKVVAEAIACGTPVCVYNATALPELASGGCGETVALGDREELVAAISRIREKGKAFYSANCVRKAKESFDLHENVKQYIGVYEELIGHGKTAG